MGPHSVDSQTRSGAAAKEHAGGRDRLSESVIEKWIRRLDVESIPRFTVSLPNGRQLSSSDGRRSLFEVAVQNHRGLRSLTSGRETLIADAYVRGDIDIQGDCYAALSLRSALKRQGTLADLGYIAEAYVLGQSRTDRLAIERHYEYPDDFYLAFLDETRTYSHAVFENDDEPLNSAMKRKLDYVLASCQLESGSRALDVGGGWGAFTEFAGKRGVEVTSLTISKRSKSFIERRIQEQSLPCRVLDTNLLDYSTKEQYDAVAILGVLEHLPRYARVMKDLRRLVKPGGYVYIDGSAAKKMNTFNGFFKQYVYPGNHCPIHLPSVLKHATRSGFELVTVINDRHSYFLTAKAWAEKLEQAKSTIEDRFGTQLFRVFRLYLWGVCRGFVENRLQAYRIVLKSTG